MSSFEDYVRSLEEEMTPAELEQLEAARLRVRKDIDDEPDSDDAFVLANR